METDTKTLFTLGLGLTEPWEVKETKLVVSETDAKYTPIARFVNTLKAHLFGIKAFFECGKATNSVLEGLNSKIQLAKRRARGFGNVENFINMIYFINDGNVFRFSHETL